MEMETECGHSILMWRIQDNSVLVVAVDNIVDREKYLPHIEEALEIIEQGENKLMLLCLSAVVIQRGISLFHIYANQTLFFLSIFCCFI